jgi:hypothetical protein
MKQTTLKVLVASALFSIHGCFPFQPNPFRVENTSYWQFCHKPFKEQDETFSNFTPSEQLDIYLTCVQNYHPPLVGLADDFAKNGEIAVQLVKVKLETAKSVIKKLYLIYALRRIAELGYYKVAAESNLMIVVRNVISSMDPNGFQKISEADLKVIEKTGRR